VEVAAMSQTHWQLAFAFLCVTSLAHAADNLPLGSADAAESADAEIAQLIKQLDSPQFDLRQEASRRLSALGSAAFPSLEKAVTEGTREASGRSLDVLKEHFQGGDGDLKREAQAALVRLSGTANSSLAQRARNVLWPPRSSLPVGAVFPNGPFGPQGITRTVTTHTSNGRREVEIRENDRDVKMTTLPNGRITLEVTDKQNARPVTRKIEAADLAELKKIDDEFGRLYEQYNSQRAQIVIPAGAAGPRVLPPMFLPVFPGRPPIRVVTPTR